MMPKNKAMIQKDESDLTRCLSDNNLNYGITVNSNTQKWKWTLERFLLKKFILKQKPLKNWMIIRWKKLKVNELHNDENLRKDDRWIISLIIIWKKMKKRGTTEGLKLFRSTFTVSTVKPFNQGILKLQEDSEEATKPPLDYVLREGIKQLSWQHLGLKLNESDVHKFANTQWNDRKLSRVRIHYRFLIIQKKFTLSVMQFMHAKCQITERIQIKTFQIFLFHSIRKIIATEQRFI
jgi:hypothetical protein